MKTNINRPFLKREDIMDRRNFKDVLLKSKSVRNPFFKSTKFFAGLGIAASIIIVVYFYQGGKSTPFINPPLADVNIPSTNYLVNSLQDTTLVYSTGSSITIPANTFMDKKGNLVSGKVDVHYREFHNAVEIFASGIPMNYDSGGVSYTFQTAGMLEIEAYQNGERLGMNPEKRINVSLASDQSEDKFNLYVLDTVARRWVYKGRPNSVAVQTASLEQADSSVLTSDALAGLSLDEFAVKEIKPVEAPKPMEPKKATKNTYRFTLDVDSAEFPEIAVYKNLMFEVGAENTTFDSLTDQTKWENVVLKENKKGKNYNITLSTTRRSVTYIVYPVFEGKNYDAAMRQYRTKMAEYERKFAAKQAREERLLAEAKKNEAKMRYQQERQEQMDAENQRKANELNRIQAARTAGLANFTIRQNFAIGSFGTWNCDQPFRYMTPTNVQASFKDKSGNVLDVQKVYLIDKLSGLVFNFSAPFKDVEFDTTTENILFAVLPDERIAFFTTEQFKEMVITDKNYTFVMEVSTQKYKSVKELKELLGV